MDTSKLGRGEMIAGAAGVVLLISALFLDYAKVDTGFGSFGGTGFEVSGFFRDLIMFATIVVSIGLAVAKGMSQSVNLPVAGSALTAGIGGFNALLLLLWVLNPPGPDGIDRGFGLFIGFIASAAIAYGGWASMQEEGTTFGDQASSVQDRMGGGGGNA